MQNWKIGDDILDTRDLEERIDELEALEADYLECKQAYEEVMDDPHAFEAEEIEMAQRHYFDHEFDEADAEELQTLRDFKEDMEGYCDWIHGETLIEESYRETYAEQLAEDIGAIDRNANWPLNHIDWTAAANDLFAHDYHYAELGGFTYYARMC